MARFIPEQIKFQTRGESSGLAMRSSGGACGGTEGFHRLLLVVIAFKNGDKFRNLQKVSNPLGEVKEFDVPTGVARAGKQADHGADAAAIDVVDVSQIEYNAVVLSEILLDCVPQLAGLFTEDNAPVAVNDLHAISHAR